MAKATNQDVNEFVQALAHPLQAEINAVRAILQSAAPGIAERIKWNAPSFYYKEDLATIHVKALQHVHIIFHHPAIDQITSPLFRGNYKGRAMVYLQDMNEVQAAQDELTNIIRQLIANIDAQ